jgi:hypothetical protein
MSREGWAAHPSIAARPTSAVGVDVASAFGVLLGDGTLAFGVAAALRCVVRELPRSGGLRVGLGLSPARGLELSLGLGAPSAGLDTPLSEPAFTLAAPDSERSGQQHEDEDDQDDQDGGAHRGFQGVPTASAIHASAP